MEPLCEANNPESGLPMAWPSYYRPMSLWSVLLGLQGLIFDAPKAQIDMGPSTENSHLKAPLFLSFPASWRLVRFLFAGLII